MAVTRPKALRPGDRIAIVAPASPCSREQVERGIAELERWGFAPAVDARIFENCGYLAGSAASRAAHLMEAFVDPGVAGIFCTRGGYGSAQLLPLLDLQAIAASPKVFVGYSDLTALLTVFTLRAGMVSFHGPMLEGRLAHPDRYDRESLARATTSTEPMGALVPDGLEIVRPGEATGMLIGGTLTQLAASLGTPWAFEPPEGHVLFLDEVNERPYRLDRLLTQITQAGLLARASAVVINELPGCDEPGGTVRGIDVIRTHFASFPGPVIAGFPSGHTDRAAITLPFGVRATVLARGRPALVIEEAAVAD
ncbi:MAG TPA: LD-carboxypeptidase [Vicinamibacterales bacterium]